MEAVIQRAQAGLPSYTLCDQPYKDAVKWWMKSQRRLSIEDEWVIPTHGTIFSLATLIRLTTLPGESIIIQPPVYNRYEQAARRLGRKTLYNRLIYDDGRYKMDFAGLESLMARPDAKIFVLCNPHNPTGNVWPEADLAAVAALAEKHGVFVYSDEIFAEVTFQGHCPSYLSIRGASGHAIVATSLGKCFNYTGVNHANILIANPDLMARFKQQRDADHYGSIDPWLYSSVLGAYSPMGAHWKDAMVEYVRGNIEHVEAFFKENLPCVSINPCQGSYVLWLDWGGLGLSEDQLRDFLEKDALLHLSPGDEYYADRPCLTRMCVAVPRKELRRSLSFLQKSAKNRGFI